MKQCENSTTAESKSSSSIGVYNEQGCLIATDAGKAAVVAEYPGQQLTRHEIGAAAARSLKNGRANGPDGIPNELLKYSSNSVHKRFASIINRSFETNSYLDPIGRANVIPLPKPNKPISLVINLQPLTQSNTVRKSYPWQH